MLTEHLSCECLNPYFADVILAIVCVTIFAGGLAVTVNGATYQFNNGVADRLIVNDGNSFTGGIDASAISFVGFNPRKFASRCEECEDNAVVAGYSHALSKYLCKRIAFVAHVHYLCGCCATS